MQLQLVRQQTILLGLLAVEVILRVKALVETLRSFHQSLRLAAVAPAAMETHDPASPLFWRHRMVFQEALAVVVEVGKVLVAAAQAVQELQINLERQDQAQ